MLVWRHTPWQAGTRRRQRAQDSSSKGQQRMAQRRPHCVPTRCVRGRPFHQLDRAAMWGLPSCQAAEAPRTGTVSLTYLLLAACKNFWDCGLSPQFFHHSSSSLANAFESDIWMCSRVLLFYRSEHPPHSWGPGEEYDFSPQEALMVNVKTREALTVNVKTTETEGNTLRSLSTWAESSEKELHPGLVQHQEASWRKQ